MKLLRAKENNSIYIFKDNIINNIKEIKYSQNKPPIIKLNNGKSFTTILMADFLLDNTFLFNEHINSIGKILPANTNSIKTMESETIVNCITGLIALNTYGGGIYIDNDLNYKINKEANFEYYTKVKGTKENTDKLIEQLSTFNNINKTGSIVDSNNINILINRTYELLKKPNLKHQINNLVRNIIIMNNYSSISTRLGDAYTRMDAIYLYKNNLSAIEIEPDFDSIGALRSQLDNAAFLNSKYDSPITSQVPVNIFLHLPNRRQDYWNLINDTKNVTGLKVRTVTLGVLLINTYLGRKIDFNESTYFLHYDNYIINILNYNKLNIDIDGIIEPFK